MREDFNEITGPDSSFIPFKQMFNDCRKLEFFLTGDMLSWVGKRAGGTTV